MVHQICCKRHIYVPGAALTASEILGGGSISGMALQNRHQTFPDIRWLESESLGLQVVPTLIGQLRATLLVDGEQGASFRFSWKLSEPESMPSPGS
jgi:hypothetical protein